MNRSFKPSKSGKITPEQHTRVREQLTNILKQLAAGQGTKVAPAITALIKKYPMLAEVNHTAAGFYDQTNAPDKALYYATRAAELEPNEPQYLSALGTLLVQSNQSQQAIEHLEHALLIDPDHAQAMGAIGIAYLETGRIADARTILTRSIERHPDDHEPIMNLALLESDIANAGKAIELMRTALTRFPDNPILHDSLAMFSCYDDQLTPQEVFTIHQDFGRCVQSKVRPPRLYPNTPDPDKRIRIGFISPDFKTHSIAYFIEPLFEHLHRDHFELFVYSTTTHADTMTARIKSHADRWRDCTQGIAATHKQIVNDRLDILVELTGHFASNQLPLMAAKPAPISISMIGYANTTGLKSITARIVDHITDPEPEADDLATEQLIRVEGCFLCYRPPTGLPELIINPDRPFTFGSFNDLRKMSPSTLRTWADILKANPESKILLKTARLGEPEVCADILARFATLDIDPSRIELLGRTPTTQGHLALYNRIDCALDTFPYTGTTTTCEALTMGVPTITLLGRSHAGRVSASLLETIGRRDLVAEHRQAYIELATQHAQLGLRTIDARVKLKDQLANSPLVDEQSYTRKIEAAYRSLWRSWCQTQETK